MLQELPPKVPLESKAAPGPESKNTFLITLIIILAVGLLAISILFVIYIMKNSQKGNEAGKNAATSNETATEANTLNNAATSLTTESSAAVESTEPAVTSAAKKADLYVKSYSFSESPRVGHEFTITVVIGNKGTASAENFYWEWWPNSSGQACKEIVNSISAGGIKTVACNYTYSDHSNHTAKVIVDSGYDVDESNENNNVATKSVTPIVGEADLYVSNYKFNHAPKSGEEFKVSITVKNKGNEDAGSFWWEWWPTWAIKACREKVDGLDAGDSTTVTCDYTYGGWAAYTTKAIIDADDDVDESNEGNNTYTKDVAVIP